MSEERIISGTPEQIAFQLSTDFQSDANPIQYHAVLQQDDRRVLLNIAQDPEESNFALTTFNSILFSRNDFRFVIYKETVIDEVSKFFGMEDAVLGYKEFDDHFIVKTNMDDKAALLFADPSVRETLQSLPNVALGIVQYTLDHADGKVPFLELKIREAVHNPAKLQQIYDAFFKVLKAVEG
jgi:hypothetical protein